MDINQAFPSDYLKAGDLKGQEVPAIVSHVEFKEFGSDGQKPVLYFQNKDKGLVLNKTNANTLMEMTGSAETNEWRGAQVILFAIWTEFQGKQVQGLRVRPAPTPQTEPVPTPQTEPIQETPAGEIPF